MRTHGTTTGTSDDGFRRLEVITGVGRRRRWTDEEKAWIVAESLDPATSVSAVARRYGLHPAANYGWSLERQLGRVDGHQPRAPRALAGPERGEVEAAELVPGVEAVELEAVERGIQGPQVERAGRLPGLQVHAEEIAEGRAQVGDALV